MNLKEKYKSEVVPAMMKKFNYKSVMQVPKLDKIVINMGVSDVKENSKALENASSNTSVPSMYLKSTVTTALSPSTSTPLI